MKRIYMILVVAIIAISNVYAQNGDTENFEMSGAVYRAGGMGHGHAGIFQYFTINNGTGHIYLSEQTGSGSSGSGAEGLRTIHEQLVISTSLNELSEIKTNLNNIFLDAEGDNHYNYGMYSSPASSYAREQIISTASEIVADADDIGYCGLDMIDPVNHWSWWPPGWYENWAGTVDDIDEIRCDGVVEFSYEESDIEVSNSYSIADAGNSHVDAHNDFHMDWYEYGELCPKIQAGRGHGDQTGNASQLASTFDPFIAEDPWITDLEHSPFNNYNPTVSFKVSDNASLKTYLLIEYKRSDLQNWEILIDSNYESWNFTEVDLTETDAIGNQFDNFHVVLDLVFELSWDLRITAIDQGANYSSELITIANIIGDMNCDGQLDISDIILLINWVLEFSDPPAYEAWAGDMDEDGSLTIMDIVLLVEIVTGASPEPIGGDNYLAELFSNDNNQPKIDLYLLNEDIIKGISVEIEIPEDHDFKNVILNENAQHMDLGYKISSDGRYVKVIISGNSGQVLDPGSGLIATINLETKLAKIAASSYPKARHILELGAVNGVNNNNIQYIGYDQYLRMMKNTLISEYSLLPIYPNPFNPSTTIQYELPKTTDISITVYDYLGRSVWTYEESAKPAGYYSKIWNGLNDNGKLAASGIYLISFSTPEFRAVQKAVLIR
ncbi:MAG: T9SS type A sorting domain-containing protein [Candidatus Marinimicrobia bacterium]|nr:T9SS type A sorting domain-containing protein [Candidatus Neomarinimicrobiota bacterium]